MEYPLPKDFDRQKELDALWKSFRNVALAFLVSSIMCWYVGWIFLVPLTLAYIAFFYYHYTKMKLVICNGELQFAVVKQIENKNFSFFPSVRSHEVQLCQSKRLVTIPLPANPNSNKSTVVLEFGDKIPVLASEHLKKVYCNPAWLIN